MARLNGVLQIVASNPLASLLQLESRLQAELENVLDQEQELWALKSRINLIVQGECNASFFHPSILVRRKRNKIIAIKDKMGNWILEERDIATFIQKGFEDIYYSSHVASPIHLSPVS